MKLHLRSLAFCAAVVLVAAFAAARPGGGSSFSGGSRSSSSSSSSGSFRSGSTSSSSSGGFRSTSSSTSSSSGFHSTSSSTSSSSSSGGFPSTTTSTSSPGSYSSGDPASYSSSSSGGGSMFGAFVLIVAIVVGLVFVVVIIQRSREQRAWLEWDASNVRMPPPADAGARRARYKSITDALAAIRSADDAFSWVLFEDFLYALYAEVHQARGPAAHALGRYTQYLSDAARATIEAHPCAHVDAVIVGGMRVDAIRAEGSTVHVDVVFTSNVQERAASGRVHAYYMEERWTLARNAGAKSRPPQRARVIGCTSCGAPLDKMIAGKCGYCQATTKPREIDWYVENVAFLAREERGPMLTGTTEEIGTDWPTVVAPDAPVELNALRARDPAFSWPAFVQRIDRIFHAFHESWVAQDLTGVRPYLSDNLFELQRYWVDAYRAQSLRNVTENPRVVTVHLARVTRDRFFDAIVVRVFATCVDYTVNGAGAVVGGDRGKTREYSEYWTLIRGAGRTGASRADAACPSCGGPLAGINMAGECTHCRARVTTGEFDWVLSRIEQDEVYERAA